MLKLHSERVPFPHGDVRKTFLPGIATGAGIGVFVITVPSTLWNSISLALVLLIILYVPAFLP